MRKPISEETREKMRQARLGKRWSDEIKQKFRIAKLGKKQSAEQRAKYKNRIPWNKGKLGCSSEETKTKMREAKVGKTPPPHKVGCLCFRCDPKKGKANCNWANGVSHVRDIMRKELRLWSLEVMSRDRFTCVMCHVTGGKLNAHHIKRFSDYPDLRTDVNNGVTLCVSCHGFVTRREKDYEQLFEDLLKL